MNAYSPSTKYQDDCDYSNHSSYTPRNSSGKTLVSKHTNTPNEFMICLRCQEKIAKKSHQYTNNYSVGDCDRNMSDYSKALSYINSCHTIINQMMNQENISSDFIRMPDLPNFLDLFKSLANSNTDSTTNKRITHESRNSSRKVFEDRSRNNSNESNKCKSPGSKCCRQQTREHLRQTTKGRFIELLPDVKHENYNKQDSLSPGTTESEESDLELNLNIQKSSRIAMPLSKYKSKMKAAHEKVIYEEDSRDDDSADIFKKKENKIEKKVKDDANKKKSDSPIPSDRSRVAQNSPTTQRSKVLSSPLSPGVCNSSVNTENTKKIKQRSASSLTPRERLKLTSVKKTGVQEIGVNFSDTAITTRSIVGQMKKIATKTLCTSIEMRNNELSQQDLDKYAKELLGSETPMSPRSNSPTIFRSSSLEKPKVEQDRNKKFIKPFPSPTMKSHASDQKRRCCQEKQSSNSSNITVSTVPKTLAGNVNSQQQKPEQQVINQQQSKKVRKGYSPQSPVDQVSAKKQNCFRKPNASPTGPIQNQNKIPNSYGFGGVSNQCSANENKYAKNRNDKEGMDKRNAAIEEVQEEEQRNEVLEENEDDCCSSPEHLNLLCDNIEALSMQSRSGSQDKGSLMPKVQYSVMEKPRDFFTTNRKCVRMRRKEYDIESDIKTDSDIEEDHFEKDGVCLSRKSSKHTEARVQMSEVLSRLGLYSNPQMPTETEQLINEAKSTRANDERNRPFREPRKLTEEGNEGIVKIEETESYSMESLNHLRRTISEESSDIKSDEDIYNNSSDTPQKSYNYCLGNSRYQT